MCCLGPAFPPQQLLLSPLLWEGPALCPPAVPSHISLHRPHSQPSSLPPAPLHPDCLGLNVSPQRNPSQGLSGRSALRVVLPGHQVIGSEAVSSVRVDPLPSHRARRTCPLLDWLPLSGATLANFDTFLYIFLPKFSSISLYYPHDRKSQQQRKYLGKCDRGNSNHGFFLQGAVGFHLPFLGLWGNEASDEGCVRTRSL
jgi:hypothetical protein